MAIGLTLIFAFFVLLTLLMIALEVSGVGGHHPNRLGRLFATTSAVSGVLAFAALVLH